jgi:hypothetical protein
MGDERGAVKCLMKRRVMARTSRLNSW